MIEKTLQDRIKTLITNHGFKSLHTSSSFLDSSKKPTEIGSANPPPQTSNKVPKNVGVPTALDKIFLVWSGRFKSSQDIPKEVEHDVIHRARSWGRIRTNIVFLIAAGLGGIAMVYLGKKDVEKGRNVLEENLPWHRRGGKE